MKFLHTALLLGLAAALPAAIKETGEFADRELPPELTLETFHSATSENLSFVEFYSPYCSHCKQLAPKWKEAYFRFEEEQKRLKIQMRQVNCVDYGDLCDKEGINYFPNLRLYAPDPQNPGKSKFVDTYPKSLTRTPENFHRYLINAVAVYNADSVDLPSQSVEVDVDLGMRVVAGEMEEPFFMGLFSSSTQQFAERKYPGSCMDCTEHRLNWDKLSNLVSTVAQIGHLNCHSHPLFCEKLGFSKLTEKDMELAPRYLMFLPKDAGIIRFDYSVIDPTVDEMKDYITKLANNYQYSKVTVRELEDSNTLVHELPNVPEDLYYPLSNKIALVFNYNQNDITPEDRAIFPYILEMVTKLPFDILFYVSNSNKIAEAYESQAKGLIKFVNSDSTWDRKAEFNRKLQLVTSMTNKPTLYMFKEHSLVPSVYQNFALESMRKPDAIETFITKNQFPLYGELTPKLVDHYFSSGPNKKNDKVVITFIKSDDAQHIQNTLFNISMVAHQYTVEKQEYYLQRLLDERNEKAKGIAELKQKNAKTTEIINAMRESVPHLFDHDDVLFTYLDLNVNPTLADELGLNIDGKKYKPGDTIVVTRNRLTYWDMDSQNRQLKCHREALRSLLRYLLSPTLVKEKTKFRSKLVGSPYHHRLRMADTVHQHGFWGYTVAALTVYAVYLFFKRVAGRRRAGTFSKKARIIGEFFTKAD